MLDSVLRLSAALATAWLFGGMLLFAGGFAAFLFAALPLEQARQLIRKAFPPFYLFVTALAAAAAAASWPTDRVAGAVLTRFMR